MSATCLFCKIVKGTIPSRKIIETEKTLAFLDIEPLAKGHALVIPKEHAEFFHQLSDESLSDLLPTAKKVALALGAPNYNLLQNNGQLAHQVVPHVHFHIIPKPDTVQGLGISWPVQKFGEQEFEETLKDIRAKLS
ncbi:HIT-like domain-containing protein [Syncephalis pseudoplumigaleata]|uniref:HIT-like domain-containing protein n=1 Tax=Syncephalis pseudoplumigaleata TaxID=1712513 RepID=A0A4P9YW03_9FUNG|nr:HIT-like domain-containing protein [Syncephalis pseudoplumigaleata]|eukprot:RKP24263.1 HIT-like domain-containing protein [Syncephalis pseudoplumigaleata]